MTGYRPLVARLADSARQYPHATAVVHGIRRVSYEQLWSKVLAVAGFLQSRGLRPGDRVAVVLENSTQYIAAYYGTLAAGGVAVALNPSARARELNCWIEHCGATWLFADGQNPDLDELVTPDLEERTVAVGARSGRVMSWSNCETCAPGTVYAADAGQPAAILYTSGTTGQPKGVTLSHGNLSANAASIIEYLGLTPDDRVLNVLPFFYSYGSSVLHTHLAVGGTLVLENSFAFPRRVIERMTAERVTGFPGVPSTFALLVQALAHGGADLRTLRYMTQAGGAMSPATTLRVRTLVPHVRLFVMYGLTEATARVTYLPPDRIDEKLGSVGIPVPGVAVEVRDEAGRTVEAGRSGDVWVRGPNVMLGYYADATATAAVKRSDGWLNTGDQGRLDQDGYLFLEGRRSDFIKSGAHRISPLDIEDVIATLPDVAQVAVIGTPDELLGEVVKAIIALRPGARLDAMSVRHHCSQHLPRYKVPRTVEFAAALPTTASGKIMRHRLREGHSEHVHEHRFA